MADGSRPDRPALDIKLPATPTPLLNRVYALLDDFDPFAIEELDARTYRVYFFSTCSRDEAARAVHRAVGPDGARAASTDVPDEGWAERSQANLRAVRIGGLVVSPPWDRTPGDDPETVIEIEPSTGFGTGHHATTRLCLALMQRLRGEIAASRRVVDLGTGSGVLAIAAIRLGAHRASGIERDPDALRNARRNVARNGLGSHPRAPSEPISGRPSIELLEADLASEPTSPVIRGDADVVLANLTGNLFTLHPAAVLRYVAPGGVLIASGFTEGEETRVRAALGGAMTSVARETEDDWVGVALRRSGAGGAE